MIATTETNVRQRPAADPPVRLRLKEATAPRGLLDGAWWPRSRDLAQELPALAGVLDPTWHRITRVAGHPLYRLPLPQGRRGRTRDQGGVVHAGTRRHKILLLTYTVGRWHLLVIPPQTSSAAADRLMAAVAEGLPRSASALVAEDEGRELAEPANARA
ncbi:DUF5994 family protein [Streptomyces fuscigenes]|uniref:DUF5994 family protein n=1 Tax=Streptomyces fuscigenes TaxID=1528880 RepID=UPI0035568B12